MFCLVLSFSLAGPGAVYPVVKGNEGNTETEPGSCFRFRKRRGCVAALFPAETLSSLAFSGYCHPPSIHPFLET